MSLFDICILALLCAVLLFMVGMLLFKLLMPMYFGMKLQFLCTIMQNAAKAMDQMNLKKKEENKGGA